MRISRDQMLMQMALIAAERGTCLRRKVGAVLALDSRPISIGYGGAPPGVPHCDETNCFPDQPCLRTLHAERNAILWAARKGIATEGATIYTTVSPCQTCAEDILTAGITRVVFRELYRDTGPIRWLIDLGVSVEHLRYG